MKTLTSIVNLIVINFLLIPLLAYSATDTVPATESFQSNGISLELFDINSTEYSKPTGEKSILAASTEFIVYWVEDELRKHVLFVWNIATKTNFQLESVINSELYISQSLVTFNNHIYFTSYDQERKRTSYWQLHGNNVKKIGETTSTLRIVEEFDGALYLGESYGACSDQPLLSRINLNTNIVEMLVIGSDLNYESPEDDWRHSKCPGIAYDIKIINNDLYFTSLITENGTWGVWQYDLTEKKLLEQPLVTQLELTQGWIRLFSTDNLFIVTANFEDGSSYSVQAVTVDNVLTEMQYINARDYGWNIGVLNNKLTYFEQTDISKLFNIVQLDEDSLEPEILTTFDGEQYIGASYINNLLYFTERSEGNKFPLFYLDKELNIQQVISNLTEGAFGKKNYKVVENGLFYIADDNEIWHYLAENGSEPEELLQVELPENLIINNISSSAHNFITINQKVYFIARNAQENTVSIWQHNTNNSNVTKLINPETGGSFDFSWNGVVELFASKDYLLIRTLVNDKYNWQSYLVKGNVIKSLDALSGFTQPLKSFDELDNVLHFEKSDVLWQYDIVKQNLTRQEVDILLPLPENYLQSSERRITKVYFDGRYLAYLEGKYQPNGTQESSWAQHYVELWRLSSLPAKKVFSSIDENIVGTLSLALCGDITRCMTVHKDSLILIAPNWHVQVDKGQESKSVFYKYDAGLRGGGTLGLQYSFSDGEYFYISLPENYPDLFYFNEQANMLEEVSLSNNQTQQAHYIMVGEAFYFFSLNRYENLGGLWLRTADKKDYTLIAEFPIYEGSNFNSLDISVVGNKFYWQQEYFNNETSFGNELAVLTLYQHAPMLSGEPETQLASQASYTFTPEASDEYSLPLIFTIKNKPNWASFNENTGELFGTPAYGDFGDYADITIAVSNGVKTSEITSFTLTIEPPVFEHFPRISGSPVTELTAGSTYSFTPLAIDEYDLPLSFTITNKPSWASFDENTGQLSGTPASTDVGGYSDIVISVSNGVKASELSAFNLNVSAVVEPPKVEQTKSSSGSFSQFLLWFVLIIYLLRTRQVKAKIRF